jgi:hypothetical protein
MNFNVLVKYNHVQERRNLLTAEQLFPALVDPVA